VILHEDPTAFHDAIQATSQHFDIPEIFIEKDYWVTKSLKQIAVSDLVDKVVFKGGTSLSKAFQLIERFSEDVDLALVPDLSRNNNQTKKLLRKIIKTASAGLGELDGGGTKGSKMRKVYYGYSSVLEGQSFGHVSDKLLIEVNAFAHPSPYDKQTLYSYLYSFLIEKDLKNDIKEFQLEPFEMLVLKRERTFAEKIMSLVKASNQENAIKELQAKVRHVYDLHQMLLDSSFRALVNSSEIFRLLDMVKIDDAECFYDAAKWLEFPVAECLLFKDINLCWQELRPVYEGDFNEMVFGSLPSTDAIINTLYFLQKRMAEYDEYCSAKHEGGRLSLKQAKA